MLSGERLAFWPESCMGDGVMSRIVKWLFSPNLVWARACLLAAHALALPLVFPLGPQEVRIWGLGVVGVAALAATFPLGAALGAWAVRGREVIGWRFWWVAGAALAATAGGIGSSGPVDFALARLVAGMVAGAGAVAILRGLGDAEVRRAGRIMVFSVALGMPVALLGAAWLDYRVALVPSLILQALAFVLGRGGWVVEVAVGARAEPAPGSLAATFVLALVSAAYLTVISGFLVFNAGHTEWHIPAALAVGGILTLAVPESARRLAVGLGGRGAFVAALVLSLVALAGLLLVSRSVPAWAAIVAIGFFLSTNALRHAALGAWVAPRVAPGGLGGHQGNVYAAHAAGFAVGPLAAWVWVSKDVDGRLVGMPHLLGFAVCAYAVAWAAARRDQPSASPAACAAAARRR